MGADDKFRLVFDEQPVRLFETEADAKAAAERLARRGNKEVYYFYIVPPRRRARRDR
jgi:hypothetical protein